MSAVMVSHQTFSVAQEGLKILKTTPVSAAIPVEIKTVQRVFVNNVETESQSATKGIRTKYEYELAQNQRGLKLANSHYEKWFLAVGINNSDPDAQRYGIWFSEYFKEIKDDDFSLYVFNLKEHYLLWKAGGICIKNIYDPVDMLSDLEKTMNTDTWFTPVPIFRLDRTGILESETEENVQNVKIVSFAKSQDDEDEFCLTVESPKSKSIFVFVSDQKGTDRELEAYNNNNEVKLKVPLPGMMRWKMKEFKTPAGVKTNKQFRTWVFRSEDGGYRHSAKYISSDGRKVVLEKENGQRVTVELSKLEGDGQEYVKLLLEAEKGLD